MPLVNKTFSDIITFSRASSATMFDSSGTLVYAPMNLFTYSEEFDNADWVKTRLNTTGTPPWVDVEVAPDGTTSADKIIEDSTPSSTHTITQSFSFVSGVTYTYSLFVKQAERTAVRVLFPAAAFTSNLTANFDISTGAWRTSSPAPSAQLTLSVEILDNGWYRISATATATATAASTILLYLLDSPSNTGSYSGDGTSGLYIWGAQFNQTPMQGGVTADLSTYYPTTSAAYQGPRLDYDPATLAARGLLIEEQRTNADKVVIDSGHTIANTYISQDITKTAVATTYTISIFAKIGEYNRINLVCHEGPSTIANRAQAQWSLSDGSVTSAAAAAGTFTNASAAAGTSVGNGWYRFALTFTSGTETSLRNRVSIRDSVATTGDGTSGAYVWGAQLEAGAFPTSYIPTTTTALTRSADVASVNTLSPWFNATEGTIFVEASPQASNVASVLLTDLNTAVTDRISLAKLITSGNANGYLRRVTYYPRRLSDAELQAITT
jgi:hypothetical protein